MRLFILYSFFFFLPYAHALEVSSGVSQTEVGLNQTFKLEINIQYENESIDQIEKPNFSQNNDFYLSHTSQSQRSSIQIFNGETKKTNIFKISYHLQPKKIGNLKIKSLTIEINGQKFQTKEFDIKVTKENTKQIPSVPSKQQKNPFNLFFNQPLSPFNTLPDFFEEDTSKNSTKLKFNLKKKTFYKGERIQAKWFLLTTNPKIRYEPYNNPSFSGFWQEELKNNRTSFSGTQIIDNILYQKILLNQLWLFPLKTGNLNIEPYKIQLFSPFSFQRKVKSFPNTNIQVKNLPLEGLNQNFSGAVGIFKIKALLKTQKTTVLQPVAYTISFTGSGHPRFIKLPKLNFPSSVKVYPPVQNSSFSDSGIGKKDFEILIVPQKQGIIKIPSFTITSFNPLKKQYEIHKTSSFSLTVKQGNQIINSSEKFFKKDEENKKKIFKPLTTSHWPHFINHTNLKRLWKLFSIFLSIGIIILSLKLFLKKKNTLKQKIQNQIQIIENLLQKKLWKKACSQMIHLIYFALYQKQTGEEADDWKKALDNLPPSLNKKYAKKFKSLLIKLENLSFGPENQKEKSAITQSTQLLVETKNLVLSFLLKNE